MSHLSFLKNKLSNDFASNPHFLWVSSYEPLSVVNWLQVNFTFIKDTMRIKKAASQKNQTRFSRNTAIILCKFLAEWTKQCLYANIQQFIIQLVPDMLVTWPRQRKKQLKIYLDIHILQMPYFLKTFLWEQKM